MLIDREFSCRSDRFLIWIGDLFRFGKIFFCVYATDRLMLGNGVELRFCRKTHRKHG